MHEFQARTTPTASQQIDKTAEALENAKFPSRILPLNNVTNSSRSPTRRRADLRAVKYCSSPLPDFARAVTSSVGGAVASAGRQGLLTLRLGLRLRPTGLRLALRLLGY